VRLRYEPDGIRLTVEDFGPQRHLVPAMAVTARAGGGNGDQRAGGGRQQDADGDGGSGGEPGGRSDGGSGGGYGLAGMRERAELLGGRLTAVPSATGFRVELWTPS
jgi:hypothetical protein